MTDRQTSTQTGRHIHKSVSRKACWGSVVLVDLLCGVRWGGRMVLGGIVGELALLKFQEVQACCAVFKHYGWDLIGSAAVIHTTISVAHGFRRAVVNSQSDWTAPNTVAEGTDTTRFTYC